MKINIAFGGFGMGFSGTGNLVIRSQGGLGPWIVVVGQWQPDTWGEYQVDFDFVSSAMTITIDGKDAGTYELSPEVFESMVLTTEGTDQNTTYYDDDVLITVTSTTECPADLSGDCDVGPMDLAMLLGAWGPCPEPPEPCPADLQGTGDGLVGAGDLAVLLGSWGPCE